MKLRGGDYHFPIDKMDTIVNIGQVVAGVEGEYSKKR